VLVIDDTGDRKGITLITLNDSTSVTWAKLRMGLLLLPYGVIESITVPLLFEVYKPKERLKPADIYRSKPEIAAGMIRELKAMGFRFKLVLADSLYGEVLRFINVLYELKLDFVVAIRSNHAVWLPREQTVRCNRWRKFKRVFSDGKLSFVIFEIILASAALNNIGN